jgi:elongation factor P
MAMSASQLRRGNVIMHDGQPCRVVEFQHVKPGKGPAYMQTKLKNILTGAIFEYRFRSSDTVERAAMQTQELQYLYHDGSHHYFMDNQSFEQFPISDDALGDAARWLIPNMNVQVEFLDGQPFGVQLPRTLELRVTATEPGVRGDTRTSVTKPATLENGAVIQVPAFVNPGELVRVDPEEGAYLERVR